MQTKAQIITLIVMGILALSIVVLLITTSAMRADNENTTASIATTSPLDQLPISSTQSLSLSVGISQTNLSQLGATEENAPGPEAYCLWPNDTLSDIALYSGVDGDAIRGFNANFTGNAGSTIHLPAKSIPQPAAAQTLIARFTATSFPVWQPPLLALCRVDPNILNFIQRPTGWASVDWENSGWGDPAFEIADLITHVAYMHVPAARWDWVIDTYCKLVDNPATAVRIQVYRQIQTAWWVVRLLRYLYEVPRNLDQRMVAPPADWQADIQAKYEHYLQAAEALYANV